MTSSKIPPRTQKDVCRLADLLLALPHVAGRLHSLQIDELEPNYSGAFVLSGTWTEQRTAGHQPALPVLVKIGATPLEVHWTEQMARHTRDLVPTLYAAGHNLSEESLSWMVMERCPLLLNYAWGDHLFTTLLESGVRFQLASRRLAPPVGPSDVGDNRIVDYMRLGVAESPLAPGPSHVLFERFEREWTWALSSCRIELCHGDLHPANAVWRVAPPDPAARALLIDPAPRALPWPYEPAYCQILYWPAGCRSDGPSLVHRMATIRRSHGLNVPDAVTLDRLATVFLAWHALRFWPFLTDRQTDPAWVADIRHCIEAAAAL